MNTLIKKTTDSVIEYLNDLDLSDWDLVNIHNEYCQSCNYPDDEIYSNDEEFFKTFFTDPMEAVRSSFYGDYRYCDEFVQFDGYGNLQSFNGYNLRSSLDLGAIAVDVIENPSNYYGIDLEEDEQE